MHLLHLANMHCLFLHAALLVVSIPFVKGLHLSEKCRDVEIPVSVSVPRYNIDVVMEDNWDAAALTSNLTRIDAGDPITSPLPIFKMISGPILSNFTIGATVCGGGSTVMILTHGIIESKSYV